MSISKFTYRERQIKNWKDVEDTFKELAFQMVKELRAIEKSGVPATSVIVSPVAFPGSRASTTPVSEASIDYRTGETVVAAGVNTITFTRPLPTSGYIFASWALFNSLNELSSATPDISSRSVSGFNITCLEAGVLHWRVDIAR